MHYFLTQTWLRRRQYSQNEGVRLLAHVTRVLYLQSLSIDRHLRHLGWLSRIHYIPERMLENKQIKLNEYSHVFISVNPSIFHIAFHTNEENLNLLLCPSEDTSKKTQAQAFK